MQMLTNEPMGGITSGLEDNESVQALSNVTSGIETLFQNIDEADNPKEIMDAIRGDEASIEQRRMELAQLVGEQDAKQTPESVLTIVQPLMTVIESTGGIADLDTETPVAPNIDESQQMEAMARMQSGQQPMMLSKGSVKEVDTNPVGNPGVMNANTLLKLLGQQSNVFGQQDPIKGIRAVQQLVPMPKKSDYTGMFTDAPSAYDEYSEVLPYLQLAKFGRVIGRSPTLIDAVTDPETTNLADPLIKLSMLKAKEAQELKAKESKAFAEAKQDASKQRAELYKPLITQLGTPDTEIMTTDSGERVFVNKKTGATQTLSEGASKFQYFDGLGLVQISPDGKSYKIKEADIQILDGPDGRKVTYNPVTKKIGQTIIEGKPKLQTFGSDTFGYYTLDPVNGTTMQLVEGKTPLSEAQKLIEQYTNNRLILSNDQSTNQDKQKATLELKALQPKIFGQDTEFLKVVNNMVSNFREEAQRNDMPENDIEKTVSAYEQKLLERYFDAKTLSQSKYDPRADEKKVFNDLLKSQLKASDESLANVTKMSTFANQASELSENFQTGMFAPTRLFIGKIAKAFPQMDNYIKSKVSDADYKAFFGGGIASGEAIASVSTQFALAFAQYLPGNLNTEEIRMIQTAAPGLTNTPEGIKLLQKMFNGQAERAKKEKEESTRILSSEDAKNLTGRDLYLYHDKEIRKWRKQNPIITQDEANSVANAVQTNPAQVFVNAGGNRVNLPANEINVSMYNISKNYRDRAKFDSLAIPKIKDFLAKNYQARFGEPGDIDQFLDPNTPEGQKRRNQLFNMGGLTLKVR